MNSITRRGMTKGLLSLMVVSTIAMIPQKLSASDWLLMNVLGIPGGSITRADWIDVISFWGPESRRLPTAVRGDSNRLPGRAKSLS